ncbi:MAG: ABC transporter ATP-binding protein [Clostridia bacterium]|nr:ABC transporter ATP-binding protein [Clostridia bacterium]MBR7034055.1 ABC transporter ATP-binding protein [Clostridia bacterium]
MIRKLLRSVREFKLNSILAPLFVSLEVVLEVLIPFFTARLIDEGIDRGDMRSVLTYGGILIAFCAVSLTFGALSGMNAAKASAGFGRNLRSDLFDSVERFSFSNIDKFSSSGIVTRLTTDVQNIQNSYQMIIRVAVRAPFMMIFSLVMAISTAPQLAWIYLTIVPILGIGLGLIMSRAHPIFKRLFKTYDKLNRTVQENLRGVRVVKAYVREDREREKFGEVSDSIYRDFSRAEKMIAVNAPLMQFCAYFCMLMVSWFGSRLIISSGGTEFSAGQLTSMITYSMQILMSLMMVSMIFIMIVISRASAERVAEVLDEKPDIVSPQNAVTEVPDGSVDFDSVTFAYSDRSEKPCLDNVDLHIRSGATVGIIGGTGSSKSTLVQLIPRLYDVVEGSVRVGGIDVKNYDLHVLRDSVAMVLQKNVLFKGTVRDNLRWGDENATDEEIERACRLAQAHDFIVAHPDGYDRMIEQGGTNVSGGQKQRICIARALLKRPKVLILDDSTSAVDTATDAKIRASFALDIPDVTKIIIAQRIASVEDADMIVVMDDGKIENIGTHEELLDKSPIYREVWETQKKGGTLGE